MVKVRSDILFHRRAEMRIQILAERGNEGSRGLQPAVPAHKRMRRGVTFDGREFFKHRSATRPTRDGPWAEAHGYRHTGAPRDLRCCFEVHFKTKNKTTATPSAKKKA